MLMMLYGYYMDMDEKEDSVSSLKVQDQENAYDASVSDPLGLL